ncbi:MAG: thermonuclease family protein, partial [Euryarchaeota archaeon]|nr:thermonuclease family protein [Euryarchaeota archaeon]
DLIAMVKMSLSKGLLAAQKMLEYQRLKTYWEIGRDITKIVARAKGELRLGQELYVKISKDINSQLGLDLSADTIGRAVQFNKNYQIFPKGTTLTFTHYIALQRIKDPDIRARLEAKAIKTDMNSLEIKDAVDLVNSQLGPGGKPARSLVCQRGQPYVYCARQDSDINGEKCFRIDCGFKINIPLQADILNQGRVPMTKKNRTVHTVKRDGKYDVVLFRDGYEKLYTYLTKVLEVVDADTFDARIDVGFGIGLDDRLRLKGIDAPELSTPAGRRAKRFLVKYFSKCPKIIIRSTKSEMYGRWLADVFALPGCADPYKIAREGEYVNQLLLDKGLARMY